MRRLKDEKLHNTLHTIVAFIYRTGLRLLLFSDRLTRVCYHSVVFS